jgi:hypothetical protein
MVLSLCVALRAFAAGDSKAEIDLANKATKELNKGILHAGGIAGNPNIEVKVVLEQEAKNSVAYYCGTTFYVFLNGVGDPRFIYGSVGIGNNTEEARLAAYNDWQIMFLSTFLNALAHSKDFLQKDGMQIYYSPVVFRGNDPFEKDEQKDFTLKLVTPYIPIIKKTVLHGARQLVDIQTIVLTVHVRRNGETDGQWQFNGEIMQGLMANAAKCNLPTDRDYMLKALYVFRGGKSE